MTANDMPKDRDRMMVEGLCWWGDSIAPGVANIEAGCRGFDIDQAVELLQCVRGRNIIGGDVVCLMPTKDQPNKITSLVAAAVMFEMISLIADKTTKD